MSNSSHSKPSEEIQAYCAWPWANLAATAWFYDKGLLTGGGNALFSPISGMQRQETIALCHWIHPVRRIPVIDRPERRLTG